MKLTLERVKSLTIDDSKVEVRGYCPSCRCNDAYFNMQKGVWHCFQCPARGTIGGVVTYVAQQQEPVYDIPKIRELYKKLAKRYHDNITDEAVTYLNSRGITDSAIEEFRLGFCSTDYVDEYSEVDLAEMAGVLSGNTPSLLNRIVIPYMVGDEVVDLRGRYIDGTYQPPNTPKYKSLFGSRSSRGASYLYNYNVIDDNQEIVITEGEFKAIVGKVFGFSIVSTPGVQVWDNSWSSLFREKRPVLVADFDARSGTKTPAYTMAKLLNTKIPHLRVASLRWLGSTKKVDIDSLLLSHGPDVLRRAIDGSIPAGEWLALETRIGRGKARRN